MITRAIESFLHGQARRFPRGHAALELVHRGEAGLAQQAYRATGARSRSAGDDHRLFLVLGKLLETVRQLAERDVPSARQMARREFLGVAHVENERAALIHEARRLEGAD